VKVGFITHLQENPAVRFGGSASEKALPHWQLQLIRSPDRQHGYVLVLFFRVKTNRERRAKQ
jgi:hypothetical protein